MKTDDWLHGNERTDPPPRWHYGVWLACVLFGLFWVCRSLPREMPGNVALGTGIIVVASVMFTLNAVARLRPWRKPVAAVLITVFGVSWVVAMVFDLFR